MIDRLIKDLPSRQILQRSQHEVMALQAENRTLEAEKRQLMVRRKRLFNEFTMGLKDSSVPLEVKKQKLMELRSIVKKKNPPPPPPNPPTKSKVRATWFAQFLMSCSRNLSLRLLPH